MDKKFRILVTVATVGTLVTSGCENMTAGENALMAGGLAGAATGIALGTTGVPVGTTLPVALGAAAAAGALGYGVSKMQVNRSQRMYAEQRGQTIVADAQRRGVNVPRYILVDTIAEKPSTRGRPVMMFDTATGRVASNRLFYVNASPGSRGYIDVPPGMSPQ